MTIKLIVGLGNPGGEYMHTRHNVGQDFVEEVAANNGTPLVATPKFFGLAGRVTIASRDVRLIVPTTYMNLSGQAVGAIRNFFKIDPEEILVVHDELDLAPGIARLKQGGGHGGHNGLKDIIAALGNNKNFSRLRIGIGHPGNAKQVSSYVLKKAPASEQTLIDSALIESHRVLNDIIQGDFEKAMRELHSATK